MERYQKLIAWQKAMDLVEAIYRLARAFPIEEKYGLISQIQRAAVSVPANIAEGYGRTHRGDYLHHLSIARGSLMEVETIILIAGRLKMIPEDQTETMLQNTNEVGKLLNGLIGSLQSQ